MSIFGRGIDDSRHSGMRIVSLAEHSPLVPNDVNLSPVFPRHRPERLNNAKKKPYGFTGKHTQLIWFVVLLEGRMWARFEPVSQRGPPLGHTGSRTEKRSTKVEAVAVPYHFHSFISLLEGETLDSRQISGGMGCVVTRTDACRFVTLPETFRTNRLYISHVGVHEVYCSAFMFMDVRSTEDVRGSQCVAMSRHKMFKIQQERQKCQWKQWMQRYPITSGDNAKIY
ncbi:hypothetical protein TNIN_494291 [Trichonephila inaurata madagascariensis]|uniref:Uncharacterized protein n=1 Tax=Trichonephila inaurata madagascariensis TaxID=2747483 RepID=A0A8X6IQT2_9ARAC|nr:hypothetical protein TNIN_494291 [Trichonephila inaurata madagascariensis]